MTPYIENGKLHFSPDVSVPLALADRETLGLAVELINAPELVATKDNAVLHRNKYGSERYIITGLFGQHRVRWDGARRETFGGRVGTSWIAYVEKRGDTYAITGWDLTGVLARDGWTPVVTPDPQILAEALDLLTKAGHLHTVSGDPSGAQGGPCGLTFKKLPNGHVAAVVEVKMPGDDWVSLTLDINPNVPGPEGVTHAARL